MASDYLDVNLLFGPEVKATLVMGELEKWNLIVKSQTASIELRIEFSKHEKKLEDIKIEMQGHSDYTLRKTAIVELRRSCDMYHYVETLISTMK